MASKPAQYLIRFDDLCPTVSRERWERFLAIVARHRVKPILAVVRENRNADLKIDEPDPEFWDRMRAIEGTGATIVMRLFVAPRCGFDRVTLRALFCEGLGLLSNGFANRRFTRRDIVWIPQQLCEPVHKESGL